MRNIGQLKVANQHVPVTLLEKADLRPVPLDAKVLSLAASMRSGEIVICEIPLIEFFSEDENSDRARIRKLLAQAADETDAQLKFEWLADSIEDVAIVEVTAIPHCFAALHFTTPATVFVPIEYFGSLNVTTGSHIRTIVSSAWKVNTIDVFDLPSRFEDELENWRAYDSSRFTAPQDEARDALAAALGIQETLDADTQQYLYGYTIGEAIGKEHMHQWLAMDLKLEHFIPVDTAKIAHVDHGNDIMLFREPTVEECAKSIAPLYQQMNYPLWHAFREGYWDTRRRESFDVLVIFDGWPVGEILGVRAVSNAVNSRNAEQWDDALNWCDDAQIAFRAFGEADHDAAGLYLARLKLVRGDILLQSGRPEEALAHYDKAREELELLKGQSASPEFEITSALINSAVALTNLERQSEARERLLRAQRQAQELPGDDPRARFMGDAIRKNLAELKD